jgi:TolB protein
MKLFTSTLVMLLWLPLFGAAQSDVYMKIQRQGFRPIPIEIEPMRSASSQGLADEIVNILRDDLEFSGFFMVLKETSAVTGTVRLTGEVERHDNRVTCQGNLLENPSLQSIFKKSYEASVESIDRIPHHLADDIIHYLIGDYGVSTSCIAYIHKIKPVSDMMLMDYNGKNRRPLVANQAINLSPAFSPDGRKVIFTSYVSGNPDLWIYDLQTQSVQPFTRKQTLATSPAWSPSGKSIAYAMTMGGNADIYTIPARGGTPRRLTSGPAIDCAPSWSPDDREIVFTSDRSGSPQVYIMAAGGGNVRRLTFAGSYNDSPVWSPRGDLIAYVSRESGGFQIYTIDITGENIRRITDGRGNHEDPTWSPDGFFIAYASNKDGRWDIYVTSWDGKRTTRMTQTGGNISPAWSPKLTW